MEKSINKTRSAGGSSMLGALSVFEAARQVRKEHNKGATIITERGDNTVQNEVKAKEESTTDSASLLKWFEIVTNSDEVSGSDKVYISSDIADVFRMLKRMKKVSISKMLNQILTVWIEAHKDEIIEISKMSASKVNKFY
jgi:hypothetical protein